jgi:hypothetical protein
MKCYPEFDRAVMEYRREKEIDAMSDDLCLLVAYAFGWGITRETPKLMRTFLKERNEEN